MQQPSRVELQNWIAICLATAICCEFAMALSVGTVATR